MSTTSRGGGIQFPAMTLQPTMKALLLSPEIWSAASRAPEQIRNIRNSRNTKPWSTLSQA